MSLIFISHSSHDNAAARDLRERLLDAGYSAEGSIFLDVDNRDGIRAGQDWEQALYRSIRACRAVIVLCSQASMASRWCFMEITHARALGKDLFPVRIDDCELDGLLTDRQVIDLSTGADDAYARLMSGIVEAGLDPKNVFTWDGQRPVYPGLMAFQQADAALFFGREAEISEGLDLLNRIRRLGEPGLVMVLGASGSGKSSVVRAGLVPRLRRDVERWLVMDPFRPHNDPVTGLAESFRLAFDRTGVQLSSAVITTRILDAMSAAGQAGGGGERPAVEPRSSARRDGALVQLRTLEESLGGDSGLDDVRRHLRLARLGLERPLDTRSPRPALAGPERDTGNPLIDLGADLLRASRRSDAKVLIVIDQFEELLDRPADHPANAFLRLLRDCVERSNAPLLVAGTMRSDFLGIFQKCAPMAGGRYETLSLGPMRNLTPVIVEPARTAGIELEPGLVEQLLADAKSEDALPLLAFTLRELYDRVGERDKLIRIADYDASGRLEGAVAQAAGQLLSGLTDAQQQLLRRALVNLVRVTGEGGYARRAARWDDLDPAAHTILQKFVDARLLVAGERGGDRVLEVAHEALFRSWGTLKNWLNESAEALRLLKDIEDVAREWSGAGRSQEYLWHGGRLARALEFTIAGSLRLGPVESAFLDASEQAAQARQNKEDLRRARQLRAALAFAVVVSVLLAGAVYLYFEAGRQTSQALARQLAADSTLLRNLEINTTSALLGIESLRRAETVAGYEALRGINARMSRIVREFDHPRELPDVAFSPDSSTIATFSESAAYLWEARTGREIAQLKHEYRVFAVVFSPDGTRLATWSGPSSAGIVRVFDARSGRELVKTEHEAGRPLFSPDGTLVATYSGSGSGPGFVFDARTGREVARLPQRNDSGVVALSFSPDSRLVATAAEQREVRVFEARTGREAVVLKLDDLTGAVAFSPDGRFMATASNDTSLRLFDARTWQELARSRQPNATQWLTISPDSTRIGTVSYGAVGSLLDATGLKEVATFGPLRYGDALDFSPDSRLVATVSDQDATRVRVFDTRSGLEVTQLTHSSRVNGVAFSGDGALVATAWGGSSTSPGGVRVFEARPGRNLVAADLEIEGMVLTEQGTLAPARISTTGALPVIGAGAPQHGASPTRLGWHFALSPDRTLLASVGDRDSRSGRVSDVSSGRELWRVAHPSEVNAFAFSPDGALVAIGSGSDAEVPPGSPFGLRLPGGTARVFEARTGREVAKLTVPNHVTALIFSPDGKWLALGTDGDAGRVFEIGTGREVARLARQDDGTSRMTAIVFSADGRLIATAAGATVHVFDARSGRVMARLEHLDPVHSLSFSVDGALLATGSGSDRGGTAQAFESATGREIVRIPFAEKVSYVAFERGERFLLLKALSGSRLTQDVVRMSDLIADACTKVDRNLTRAEWATYLGAQSYRETCRR